MMNESLLSDKEVFWYCSVAVKGSDQLYAYISDDGYIKEGSYVEMPFGRGDTPRIGIVESCGMFPEESAPFPVSRTKHITRIATEEEYDAEVLPDPYDMDDYDDDETDEADYLIENECWDEVFEWASEHDDSEDPAVLRKVFECYELCMVRGMPFAACNLGTFYYSGRVVERDYRKAFELYKIAADAGEIRGICNCGYCFYYGRHQEPDYAEALRYFSLGALFYNDANCLYKLGDLYLNGYGVEKNEKYAWMLYVRSLVRCREAEDENFCMADAQFRVGRCLLRGIGTEKDVESAHEELCCAIMNFYRRRRTDEFVGGLIRDTKELIAEAQEQLDGEII